MDLDEKLKILSDAAKYDVSCSSSGSSRNNSKSGLGNAAESGICHSFTPDGRCISLLKILLTNYCIFDCAYCINKVSSDIKRAAFTPNEVADLTMNFYRRNYIEGLFLSSSIIKNPNYTMELMLKTAALLRNVHNFNGYIHLKAIPGADKSLIKQAGNFADRMSVNIELPSSESLKLLAPQKNKESILLPMNLIKEEILSAKDEINHFKSAKSFVPGGQSTQLIIGATPESDYKILNLSQSLYKSYKLKRVYYSAYLPVSKSPNLPQITSPPLLREHRLYQADWLLRFYGFNAKELLDEATPNFNIGFDPKTQWALKNFFLFPLEINSVSYNMLIRIPGIGIQSAKRIVAARKVCTLSFQHLKKIGVTLKRAQYFITCAGKYYGDIPFSLESITTKLTSVPNRNLILLPDNLPKWEQLTFLKGGLQ